MKRLLLPLALAGGLAACTSTLDSRSPVSCETGAPARMVQMFFGRSSASGIPVSDAAWQAFVDGPVTTSFPEGFTVLDAQGQWRDQKTNRILHEPSKLIVVAVPAATVSIPVRIAPIIAAYKARFAQQSVGVVITEACAAF
jgi:hypothetical protein